MLRAALVASAVILVDQGAKAGASQISPPPRNPDLAFGVARGPAPVLLMLAVVVLALFVAVVGRVAMRAGISPVVPALIAGGMLGNMIDRARLGAVRDFIPMPLVIINLADIAIIIGIFTLAVGLLVRRLSGSVIDTRQPPLAVVVALVVTLALVSLGIAPAAAAPHSAKTHCDPIDPAACLLPFPNDFFTVPDA